MTYKNYTFQVAYFSDWYNGTGWSFRFPTVSPDGIALHTNQWMGLTDTQDQAVASAQAMIDQYVS
jgi:hypothetical protein